MKYYYFVIVPFFIYSCSQLGLNSNHNVKNDFPYGTSNHWLKTVDEACLTSEGKGKLTLDSRQYSFSYNSSWIQNGDGWALALDVPLRGEEGISSVKKTRIGRNGKAYFISGSLKNLLDEQLINQKSKAKMSIDTIDELLQDLSWAIFGWKKYQEDLKNNLLNFAENCQEQNKDEFQCSYSQGQDYTYTKNGLFLSYEGKSGRIRWSFYLRSSRENSYFSKQVIALKRADGTSVKNIKRQKETELKGINLELFPQKCLK